MKENCCESGLVLVLFKWRATWINNAKILTKDCFPWMIGIVCSFNHRCLLPNRGGLPLMIWFYNSETLNNEYIGRIYQMSSWQFDHLVKKLNICNIPLSRKWRIRHLMNSVFVFVLYSLLRVSLYLTRGVFL